MTTSTTAQTDDFHALLQDTLAVWTPILGDNLTGLSDAAYADVVAGLMGVEADLHADAIARQRRAAFRVVGTE